MEIDNIIMRILTGTSSYEDTMEFVKWLNASEEHQKEFQKIKSYWNSDTVRRHDVTSESSFKKLQIKILHSKAKIHRRRMMLYYSGIAASLLIVFALGFFMQKSTPEESFKQYTCMTAGSTSTFYMADSTKVILNKNSEITYTSLYGQNERRVKLSGEAYFEVTKNTKSPFIVDMDGGAIKVLGTKFSAKSHKGSTLVHAILLEGSVRFTSKEQNVLMKPNQKLLFNKYSKDLQITEVNPEQEVAWKDGLLKYRSLSFKTLMDYLAKDYGVKIVINNKRLLDPELKVSGSFEQEEAFEKVLEVINRTVAIKWKNENGIYYIN